MMQLDKLVLFNRDGDTRSIALNAGALNVITGDSRTAKVEPHQHRAIPM